jgi:hypothetical protein
MIVTAEAYVSDSDDSVSSVTSTVEMNCWVRRSWSCETDSGKDDNYYRPSKTQFSENSGSIKSVGVNWKLQSVFSCFSLVTETN